MNCIFKTLTQYGFSELSEGQTQKAMSITTKIALFRENIIYRGVSKEYLMNRLSKPGEVIGDDELARRLFYFGEKSRHFLDDCNKRTTRSWLKNFGDTGVETGRRIFEKIKELKKSNNIRIIEYVRENTKFFEFFENNANKQVFSSMICTKGEEVRDYFICFLHTAGHIGIGNRSNAISTTTSLRQAQEFSGGGDGFIIVSVLRPGICRRLSSIEQIIESSGVPVIPKDSAIYPEQKEVTLRAGIFPHDIVGLAYGSGNEFLFNPHIFNGENAGINILESSLNLDQSDFEISVIEKSRYISFFNTFDGLNIDEIFVS